ncbi:hypothetical protein NW765_000995 [Fusarium oxysporum]|uniref:Cyclin-dependent kinase inhibitor 1c n=1 Tax=Fusarium oxysporum TaxID=5507 RepID=A0A420P4Q8_FUSOX|nr:hypothetical protein NW765_000995 [Fusarium oxysporum]KAJ4280511.1 hypothetical protein NW764_004859 [Fusarium oxysporum]RKK87502.1 hypothetical protein BFJ71_g13316 [Fusarium oxysporum]RKL22310.1 hypothetical protein BFJ68_g1559 [Fusarium oxysporum]
MRYNAFAFMALVNGLAQANRFDWQSESKADVAKHEHKNAADPVFKVEVNEGHRAGNKGQVEVGKLKKEEEKAEEEAKKLEEKLQKKEDELELKAAQARGSRHHRHTHSSYSPDPTYDPVTRTTGYHRHHSGHLQKGPYTLDGEKFDYIHKPKVHFHTSYTTHAPTLSPGCVGDKCARKPCKECNGNWAQPGCWHCKAHGATSEEVAEQAAKTTKHAPEETKAKEEEEDKKEKDPYAKTYTHGDKTVIVPKETKAPEATRPEAPQIEQPHKEGPKVIVIKEPKKKPEEEKKLEEKKEEKKKYPDEKPKHEYPKEEPKHEYPKGKPKKEPKHEYPKGKPKKEDICDKVHHHGQPSICDKIKHQHHKVDEPKKENICSKPKGCHPHHQAPAPAPAPHHEVKLVPAPVPAPHYPEQKPEIQPAPIPAPAPQQPEQKPGEVQPAPAPAPAPAQPEGAKPEEGKHGNAPSVPITVPKSGATYNRVSVGIAVFAGIASMMLL